MTRRPRLVLRANHPAYPSHTALAACSDPRSCDELAISNCFVVQIVVTALPKFRSEFLAVILSASCLQWRRTAPRIPCVSQFTYRSGRQLFALLARSALSQVLLCAFRVVQRIFPDFRSTHATRRTLRFAHPMRPRALPNCLRTIDCAPSGLACFLGIQRLLRRGPSTRSRGQNSQSGIAPGREKRWKAKRVLWK